MTDEQVRLIALFFLFSLMDEKVALQAAHKTVAGLKAGGGSRSQRGSDQDFASDGSPAPSTIVRAMRKSLETHRKLVPRNRPVLAPETTWHLSDHVDIATWAKFQKDASDQEVTAVLLSKVLGFKDQEIADGLQVSIGTARYRVGKGIRQLGVINVRAK